MKGLFQELSTAFRDRRRRTLRAGPPAPAHGPNTATVDAPGTGKPMTDPRWRFRWMRGASLLPPRLQEEALPERLARRTIHQR
jgi:hypothetical protein